MANPWQGPGSSTDLTRPRTRPGREDIVARPRARSSALVTVLALTAALAAVLAPGTSISPAAFAQDLVVAQAPASGGLNGRANEPTVSSTFDLSFSIGKQGRTGCLVCHSDKNLTRMAAGRQRSYYISDESIRKSAHRDVSCLGCHIDFNFRAPHGAKAASFRVVAGLSCRNCHARAWGEYQQGVHGSRLRDNPRSPICSDCHGAHEIGSLSKDTSAREALHRQGYQVCGRCHQRYWDNYSDYYHGAAYRQGAKDAPACWQCHRPHDIKRSKDPDAAVNKAHLPETCGACHEGVRPGFLDYTKLVHSSEQVRRTNVVLRYYDGVRNAVAGALGALVEALRSVFG